MTAEATPKETSSSGHRRRAFAVYGKGGIGKSTVVSNLSYLFQRDGLQTLQIGFDPKADSSHLHIDIEDIRPALPDLLSGGVGSRGPEAILQYVQEARTGVHCLEVGGVEPGVGCAGAGMSTVMRVLDELPDFYEQYRVICYDVLGDVVCGGFAVPLRRKRAEEVYIVVSTDVASVYAANNIARAVANNRASGVRLAGLIANRSLPDSPVLPATLEAFARRLGSGIIGTIPMDATIVRAAYEGGTASELYPESEIAEAYRVLYQAVRDTRHEDAVEPTPLSNRELMLFLREQGTYGRPRTQA